MIWWYQRYDGLQDINPVSIIHYNLYKMSNHNGGSLEYWKVCSVRAKLGAELSENQDTPFYTWVWCNYRLGHLGAPVYGFSPAVVLDVLPLLETHPLQTHDYCSLTSLAFWDNSIRCRSLIIYHISCPQKLKMKTCDRWNQDHYIQSVFLLFKKDNKRTNETLQNLSSLLNIHF